jgi:CheY-like chemotaxis protein
LRDVLCSAIEALRPEDTAAPHLPAWRTYKVLSYRFAEQVPQREVANELGLSVRQLRRVEKAALETLAYHLWAQSDLEHGAQALIACSQVRNSGSSKDGRTPSRQRELAWLEQTAPVEPADILHVIRAVLAYVVPLARDSGVTLHCDLPDELPLVTVQPTALRQALCHVFTMATCRVPGGCVALQAQLLPSRAYVHIQVAAQPAETVVPMPNDTEDLAMARRLLQIAGGCIDVDLSTDGRAALIADIGLPTRDPVPVLVVDDNIETLSLLQRYLRGTRYGFSGTSDPHQVMALVGDVAPKVIVLDIMLPEIDGWELLGRLREHPDLRSVPIIVCTILSQEQLAMSLGAAAYLRKPVSRSELLSELDRQIVPRFRKPPQST